MALARCKRRNSERCMPDSNAPPPSGAGSTAERHRRLLRIVRRGRLGDGRVRDATRDGPPGAEQLRLILADLPPAPVPVGKEVTDPRLAPNEVAASRANSPSVSPSADLVPRPTLPEDRIPAHSVIVGIMGGAGVTVRYPGEASRDARLRLRSERKARKLLERGK